MHDFNVTIQSRRTRRRIQLATVAAGEYNGEGVGKINVSILLNCICSFDGSTCIVIGQVGKKPCNRMPRYSLIDKFLSFVEIISSLDCHLCFADLHNMEDL
ncbi:hypothetical protein ABFS83_06G139700 [Erythranthe nasuta]